MNPPIKITIFFSRLFRRSRHLGRDDRLQPPGGVLRRRCNRYLHSDRRDNADPVPSQPSDADNEDTGGGGAVTVREQGGPAGGAAGDEWDSPG